MSPAMMILALGLDERIYSQLSPPQADRWSNSSTSAYVGIGGGGEEW